MTRRSLFGLALTPLLAKAVPAPTVIIPIFKHGEWAVVKVRNELLWSGYNYSTIPDLSSYRSSRQQ